MPDSLAYSTAKLVAVVPNLKTSQNFLLDLFFPQIVTYDTEEIAIDVEVGLRRLAPFVSPLVEGRLVEQRRFQTNRFKPAYIKDKRAPDLRRPVHRAIGERIGGGELTAGERMLANLQSEMTDQIDMIDRRLEWMAAQALTTGTVTVAGDGYPTTVVDFGRSSTLSLALTGASKWGATVNGAGGDVNIVPQITSWMMRVLKASGAGATDIVFTPSAWGKFLAAEGVQGAIYYPNLANSGNDVNPAANVQKGGVFMGRWGGYRLWLYNDWYIDGAGVEQPMLVDGTIIIGGPQMMGIRAFGMIMDPRFAYRAMAYAPKTWIQEDPAQQILMMQSAPMVIPARVNACLAAVVCDPAS